MVRIKLPTAGTWDKATAGRQMWLNPSRDIVNGFPHYCSRAAEILNSPDSPTFKWFIEHGGKPEEMTALCKFLAEWIYTANNFMKDTSLREATEQLRFKDLSKMAKMAFGSALMNVVMSAYFCGCKESFNGPDDDVDYALFAEFLERLEFGEVSATGVTSLSASVAAAVLEPASPGVLGYIGPDKANSNV